MGRPWGLVSGFSNVAKVIFQTANILELDIEKLMLSTWDFCIKSYPIRMML